MSICTQGSSFYNQMNGNIMAWLSRAITVTDYHISVVHFSQWCKHNFLHLNVAKTKEIAIGFSSDLNLKAITRIATTIAKHNTHPLNSHFTILPSGSRYRTQWQKPGACSHSSPKTRDRDKSLLICNVRCRNPSHTQTHYKSVQQCMVSHHCHAS